jgi:hypothetical protein
MSTTSSILHVRSLAGLDQAFSRSSDSLQSSLAVSDPGMKVAPKTNEAAVSKRRSWLHLCIALATFASAHQAVAHSRRYGMQGSLNPVNMTEKYAATPPLLHRSRSRTIHGPPTKSRVALVRPYVPRKQIHYLHAVPKFTRSQVWSEASQTWAHINLSRKNNELRISASTWPACMMRGCDTACCWPQIARPRFPRCSCPSPHSRRCAIIETIGAVAHSIASCDL